MLLTIQDGGPSQGKVCVEGSPSVVSVKLGMVVLVAIKILESSLAVFGPTAAREAWTQFGHWHQGTSCVTQMSYVFL